MFGEGLEKVELQREQGGREAFPGTTNRGIDQQHRTTFYALKYARSSYKPAIFMDSGFLVDTSLEMLDGGGLSRCVTDEMHGVFWFRRLFVRQNRLGCCSFTRLRFYCCFFVIFCD